MRTGTTERGAAVPRLRARPHAGPVAHGVPPHRGRPPRGGPRADSTVQGGQGLAPDRGRPRAVRAPHPLHPERLLVAVGGSSRRPRSGRTTSPAAAGRQRPAAHPRAGAGAADRRGSARCWCCASSRTSPRCRPGPSSASVPARSSRSLGRPLPGCEPCLPSSPSWWGGVVTELLRRELSRIADRAPTADVPADTWQQGRRSVRRTRIARRRGRRRGRRRRWPGCASWLPQRGSTPPVAEAALGVPETVRIPGYKELTPTSDLAVGHPGRRPEVAGPRARGRRRGGRHLPLPSAAARVRGPSAAVALALTGRAATGLGLVRRGRRHPRRHRRSAWSTWRPGSGTPTISATPEAAPSSSSLSWSPDGRWHGLDRGGAAMRPMAAPPAGSDPTGRQCGCRCHGPTTRTPCWRSATTASCSSATSIRCCTGTAAVIDRTDRAGDRAPVAGRPRGTAYSSRRPLMTSDQPVDHRLTSGPDVPEWKRRLVFPLGQLGDGTLVVLLGGDHGGADEPDPAGPSSPAPEPAHRGGDLGRHLRG